MYAAWWRASSCRTQWTSDDVQPPAAKRTRVNTVTSGLDFLLRGRSKLTAKSEFHHYLRCDVDDDLPVLSWWQKHEATFQGYAVVARKYLGIPATSMQSEHLFSATGRLDSLASIVHVSVETTLTIWHF